MVALREADEKKTFPQQYWDALTESGLHALAVPKEYGGEGAGFLDQVTGIVRIGPISNEMVRNIIAERLGLADGPARGADGEDVRQRSAPRGRRAGAQPLDRRGDADPDERGLQPLRRGLPARPQVPPG